MAVLLIPAEVMLNAQMHLPQVLDIHVTAAQASREQVPQIHLPTAQNRIYVRPYLVVSVQLAALQLHQLLAICACVYQVTQELLKSTRLCHAQSQQTVSASGAH